MRAHCSTHDKAPRYQNNLPGHSHAECNRGTRDATIETIDGWYYSENCRSNSRQRYACGIGSNTELRVLPNGVRF